ncbi:rhamnan synthesis F family protein [Paraburkholderia sp. A3BS-1L]|uniref:rhamnan synthesis F family protein n=1 Tax=Paraburkholderia sp. A3BS-1L TaxID=3028375 RepID=UPI003DA7F819
MKRLCLFAGYSPANRIDDYVVHYLRELSKFADVYYQAANDAHESELEKLDDISRGRWAQAHEKYDFGSWQKLIFRLGWREIEKYDSIILANDSNYGPLHDLCKVFERMDAAGLDAWGITENYGVTRHLQSYFLTFNRAVIDSQVFRDFFESIAIESSKIDICLKYEIGLGRLLSNNNFSFAPFINRSTLNIPFGADISSYQNTLLRHGSPFLKRKIFTEYGFASEDFAETRTLLHELKYPLEWIPEPSALAEPEIAAPAEITTSAEAPPPAEVETPAEIELVSAVALQNSWARACVKRILRPLYRPIKARIVDNLLRTDQNVAHLLSKTTRIEMDVSEFRNQLISEFRSQMEISRSQMRAFEASVGSLSNAAADIQGQLSGISQSSRDAATRINDIQGRVSGVSGSLANSDARINDIQERVSALSHQLGDSDARLADLQTSAAELHGHLDWAQRDILIALMSQINFSSSKGFKCVTDNPIAYDSPDHIHPVGTVIDHTRHPRFIRACEDFFGADKQLSFLDIGCSAGGIVLDAILRGHIGIGLEGSDISRLQQRGEWRLLRDHLFTCDITRPFELGKEGNRPYQFDVISAWEVLEHLTPEGVEGMFANLALHTHSGSVFACSISQVDGGFTEDGRPLHQTLEPLPWWRERAAKHGFEILDSDAFSRLDFARGNGNASIYYRPAHSYRENAGDCFLVVFQRQ